ncbi:DNA repair and recombination protein radC [Penicillium macrosclerotiorum]|uniref:DNA repair and recombination protein radC n=1 Tax=Penicillium macrosclerotiorum TaxID=303699 RepID=UPI0025468120|nr:DNA repair and recombination protein radC [Penicillium macrosclerotiorum]KAJ5673916.1 DNA repair and recombination protein radC [Penicillium macrosclerotiorum]
MPAVGDQHRGGPASIGMPNAPGPVTANPFEEPERRINEYTAMEIATLQARLDKKLGPEYISSRPGAAGSKVHYLSADKCINLANEVFGFNGWSSSIQKIDIDFIEENQNTGKISLGLSVIVRVTLRDGSFHEDIGYGHIENCKGKAAAFEKSKKEGTTDALKRTLRNFGNVLGNCVYDKDYLSKVTKVKSTPARWDVDELHRHPDFAPIKKETIAPKRIAEDDDLPPRPRPAEPVKNNVSENIAAFDGDGEFGSDLFDEADFVVTTTGNPDEISIESEHQQHQPPTPMNRPAPQRAPPGRFDSSVVTPSKPERWNPANAAAARQSLPPNARANPPAMSGTRQSMPAPAPQSMPRARPTDPGQQMHNSNAQPQIKREPGFSHNQDPNQPPAGSQSVGFYSARAVDLVRDNPNAVPAPGTQFDPHAESPSIRKTAGVDHSKSVPISKPMLSGAPPANNSSRDYVNPATDLQRRVGAPGGPSGGVGSPLSRGPSTSSYRPLTRPNIDPRNLPNAAVMNRGGSVPPQNLNGKRPPLNDVTNASTSPVTNSAVPPPHGLNESKRPRVSDGPPGQQQPPEAPPK